jgi:hypothetical protein
MKVLKVLMLRDSSAAAAQMVGQQSLAAEVLRQWQATDKVARELEGRWPALQQLLIGILSTQQQLQEAAKEVTASAVSASVQATELAASRQSRAAHLWHSVKCCFSTDSDATCGLMVAAAGAAALAALGLSLLIAHQQQC